MIYPTLTEQPTSRQMISDFAGYNHNDSIGDGEFYDMKNMTSSFYPVLAPRVPRGTYASPTAARALIAKDALCYIDGANFVINNSSINLGLSNDLPKQMISMGAYVIILPDKKYINTADLTDYGNIEASFTTQTNVTFTLCHQDAEAYVVTYTQSSEPTNPANNDVWLDTSSTPHVLKQYAESSSIWISIPTTYVKIAAAGIGANFAQYDGISIYGLDGQLKDANNNNIEDSDIANLNGAAVVWDRADDYIVVVGIIDTERTISNVVTVARSMPKMDFVVESQNRLWGCRYGTNANNEVVNEIYASKLGDFKNWSCYMGLSTDSYTASIGTDGQFTGAISYLGYPLFFKENCLHKVYGNYPANFQIQQTALKGVQKGSSQSLAIVNNLLLYKSAAGICAYDGSLPEEISMAFGTELYTNAVAGAHANKYYVSMKDSANVYHLFVYDALRGMWHHEDNTQADAWCSCDTEMYYIDHADGKIRTVLGSGTPDTALTEWMAETGYIGLNMPDKKYISRINIRMWLAIGARVHIFAEYDSSGRRDHLFTMTGHNLRTFTIPLRLRRCDHARLRIEGEGPAKIFSIARTVEQGSDI